MEPDRIRSKVDGIVGGKGCGLPFCPHNNDPNHLAVEQEHMGCCVRAICVKGVTHVLEQTWRFCLSKGRSCRLLTVSIDLCCK